MKNPQVVEEDSAALSISNQGDLNGKNNVPNDEEIKSKRRGRPRRSIIPSPEFNRDISPNQPLIPVVTEKELRLNRRRALKKVLDGSDGGNAIKLEPKECKKEEIKPQQRKQGSCGRRGKKSTICQDDEYVPREKSKNPDTVLEAPPKGKTKCAKCKEEITSNQWSKHNSAKHNGMGWREGEEEPNFSNESFLRRHLVRIHKAKRKLVCETCGTVKKSVAGFMSHITFCGKNEEERQALMWTCPLCRGCYKPSSIEFHERWHREQDEIKEKREQNEQNGVEEDPKNHGKRKAAENAVSKISEFTELIKDNTEEQQPAAKKKKLSAELKELIDVPRSTQIIPSVFKGFWKRSIAAGKLAYCRQPGCDFSSSSLSEICTHHGQCNFVPRKNLICKICQFSTENQTEIADHVREKHPEQLKNDSDFHATDESNESDDEERNTNEPRPRKSGRVEKFSIRAKFLGNIHQHQDLRINTTFLPAIKWSMNFELENYSFALFESLRPNVMDVPPNHLFESYLPQQKLSMSMKNTVHSRNCPKVEENKGWTSLKRFQGDLVVDLPVIFTGGPVWAMAWLPIPSILYDEEPSQYLAVSTHPTMNASYQISNSYIFRNCIQIWDFGHLAHGPSFIPKTPKCSYILAHENGTVWSMEWCPSGTYDNYQSDNSEERNGPDSLIRMGLLATAGSDGRVHIYSLPFPNSLNLTTDPPVFKTKPVLTLHVNEALERKSGVTWQCTKVSWSKTDSHDNLVAGFSNGYVALWDLKTISSKLSTRRGLTVHLNAYKHFYAHGHAVMYAEIIPIGENRFLVTAGMDRYSKIWDLDTILPVEVIKRGVAVNGAWIAHWPATFIACDDALGLSHTQTHITGVREPQNRAFPMLPTNSTCYGLATSDWANGICHGTLAGEVAAIFPSQMLYVKDFDELPRKRWLLSSVEVVNLTNEKRSNSTDYEYAPETYEKCHKKFGIVFKDDLSNSRSNTKKRNRKSSIQTESMSMVPVEQYPFASVNRIAWNHNAWSYLWLAAGYENGLVRVMHLKALSTNSASKTLLADHAKKMLDKFSGNRIT